MPKRTTSPRRPACTVEALEDRKLLAVSLQWSPLNDPGVGGQVTSLSVSPYNSQRVLAGGDMLGIAVSTDGGSTWGSTFGLGTGGSQTVESFTWTGANTVWAGTAKGPLLSTDGGVNWTLKRNGMPAFEGVKHVAPVQVVVADPNDSSRLLAFTGNKRRFIGNATRLGEVYQSQDGGNNWALRSTIAAGSHVEHVAYKSPVATTDNADDDTLYAVVGGALRRSADDGATWATVGAGLSGTAKWLTVSPTAGGTLWVSTSSGVFKSTNAGDSFVSSSVGLPSGINGGDRVEVDRVATDGVDVLYFAIPDGNGRGIYKSTNGGASWASANTFGATPYPSYGDVKPIAIDPANASRVFAGTNTTVWRTTNAAASWVDTSSVQNAAGAWRGTGWSGQVSLDFKWNPYNTNQSMLLAMDSGKFVSNDDLQTWVFGGGGRGKGMYDWSGARDVAFTQTAGLFYVAQGQGNDAALYRTTNGGANWATMTLPAGTSGDIASIFAHPTQTNKVWLVRSGGIYASTDSGASWTQVGADAGTINTMTARPDGSQLYVGGAAGLWSSTDGTTFSAVGGSSISSRFRNISKIKLDPTSPNRVYTVNARHENFNSWDTGAWRYDASANTWTLLTSNGNASYQVKRVVDIDIDPTVADGSRVVVITDMDPYQSEGTESGVWLSEGRGNNGTWAQQNVGLPQLRGKVIRFQPGTGKLVVGLNGRGYFTATTSDAPAPVVPAAATGLSATPTGPTQVNLVWTDNANNETGFKIERRLAASSAWGQIETVGANVTSYSDTNCAAATAYVYRVRATNAVGDSTDSNEATATTPAASGVSPYVTVQAEGANANSGVTLLSDRITSFDSGDWVRYDALAFGASGSQSVTFRLASTTKNARFTVRLGSTTGTLLATVNVIGTASTNTFVEQTVALAQTVTGTQTLFLVANRGSAVADIDWLRFAPVSTPTTRPAPVVTAMTINDGSAQRSMVRSFTLSFDRAVTLGSGALSLVRRSDGQAVALTASPASGVAATSFTVSVGAGSDVVGGSVADGVYDLTLTATAVQSAGDGQHLGGGDRTYAFHRLFGDQDGDGDVDGVDSLRFRQSEGSLAGDPSFRAWFDFDGDDDVDGVDSLRFKQRQGIVYTY
jgi:hypothetical protein